VTLSQYARLKSVQNKIIELNGVINTITTLGGGLDSPTLKNNEKFQKLLNLRDKLKAFLPQGDLTKTMAGDITI